MTPTPAEIAQLMAVALETRNWPLLTWLRAMLADARLLARRRR